MKSILAELAPSAKNANRTARGRGLLVDGTLSPTWPYRYHKELWNKKHGTTGFKVQFISRTDGTIMWISDPLQGSVHDAKAYDKSGAKKIVSKSAGGIADKGYQGTGMVTPAKKQKGRKVNKYVKRENTRLSSLCAPAERAIANFKNWKMFHADYRRPYGTTRIRSMQHGTILLLREVGF